MFYVFLGPDEYTKNQEIQALKNKEKADLVVFSEINQVENYEKLLEVDLFSKPKVFVLESINFNTFYSCIDRLILSKNIVVYSTITLDKRKKENKDLLANKSIVIKNFNLPHGVELNKWIEKWVGDLGGKIEKTAVEELAVRLGRDQSRITKIGGKVVSVEEVFNLWQVDSEIKKLIAYASGKQIEIDDVKAVVMENLEIDAFQIINSIGSGEKNKTFELTNSFLEQESGSDEKTGVIKLNALLADQMRSLAIVQDFMKEKISEEEILEKTGWKSGRLFVMKKNANKLKPIKVLETLKKLEALDEELKTSSTPPKVLIDLIVSQVF